MNSPKFRENAVTAVTRDAQQITVHVRGKDGVTLQPIVLRFADCSEQVRAEAMGYGLEVRLTRAAAIEHAKAGRPATAEEKHERIRALAEHYASGTDSWTMAGGGGGGLNADTTALIEALSLALECDRDLAEAQVREMTSAQRAALRLDEEIKPWLDQIYADRAKVSGVDTKGLLAKLKARSA